MYRVLFSILLLAALSSGCEKGTVALAAPATPVTGDAPVAEAADWPQFLGPTQDNVSPETGLLETLPAKGPRVVWEQALGTGYGPPSVRGDRLVVHHRRGDQEIVQALDAATGQPGWHFEYPSHFVDPFGYNNGPRCSPLLTQDRCYTFGAEGVLLCLDLATGRQIWRRDTGADFNVPEAFFGVGSSPILEGNLLIAMVGGQPNSGVVAFDAATGKTVWENVGEKTWNGLPMLGWPGERTVQWNVNDPAYNKQASYCTPVAATIHGRRHILCCTRQGLVSLDPATGAARFSYWFRSRADSSVNAMTPVVSGDTVFISSAYFKSGSVLLRVHPDGLGVDEVWRGLQLEMHWSRPVLADGRLYAFSGRNEPDARFRCVRLADGKLEWDRDEGWPNGGHAKLAAGEPAPNVFGRGSAILADGKIIALGEAGLLGLFKPNPEKLEEIARWQVPQMRYPCWAGPVLAHKRLFLRSEEMLVCLDFAR
ncbi:MAG TPA: PQQ-binding-like beta-propeller repeat protein [Chthoniobacteraceae bacterium]|jgi:outer membrane protein assembly factor BamB|nr:PQQ-binding-like beta-propeller repeat protein [Chthoniobacteraceae bacterium]